MTDVETHPLLPPALSRLPIFPLPSVQLFPGTLLPLHVFEPRYRALTRACLSESAGSRLMAVPSLLPGYEASTDARPEVTLVCGVGEIVQHRALADGRFDVLLRGVGRIRIVSELPAEQPYRLVTAIRLDDHRSSQASAEMSALTVLCDRLASVLPQGGPTLRELMRQEDEPGRICDLLAGALIAEAEERQDLLETLDVAARVDRLSSLVAALVARFNIGGSN